MRQPLKPLISMTYSLFILSPYSRRIGVKYIKVCDFLDYIDYKNTETIDFTGFEPVVWLFYRLQNQFLWNYILWSDIFELLYLVILLAYSPRTRLWWKYVFYAAYGSQIFLTHNILWFHSFKILTSKYTSNQKFVTSSTTIYHQSFKPLIRVAFIGGR